MEPDEPRPSFLARHAWLWIVIAFLVLIAAWSVMITAAVRNRPERIELPEPGAHSLLDEETANEREWTRISEMDPTADERDERRSESPASHLFQDSPSASIPSIRGSHRSHHPAPPNALRDSRPFASIRGSLS